MLMYITYNAITYHVREKEEKILNKNIDEVISKLEGYLKFRNITKKKLAELWQKNEAYIYRRFSKEVELTLSDIWDLCRILKLNQEEIVDIFF